MLITICIIWLVSENGIFPSGSDTMAHLYKADLLYQNIQKGVFYPLYDSMWYNGVEIMRYWAPLSIYILTLCQALAGGNILTGYLVFVGFIFFLGACIWLYLGKYYDRLWLGGFLGILWFFMPNNLMAFFTEGNLPRSVCIIILPLFIHFIHTYLMEDVWSSLFKIIICFSLMALCHTGYAGMIALSVFLFLIIYSLLYKNVRKGLHIIICMFLAFLCIGIWAYASLQGGITSTDSSSIMKEFFQSIFITLNPVYRLQFGSEIFYFGLSAFLTALFGILFGRKKTIPGFLTSVIICLCTTLTMYSLLVLLPGSQYLWMLRFISIGLCMILYSLLLWNTLRKSLLLLLCILLVADTFPSLNQIYGNQSGISAEERLSTLENDTLLTKAKEITKQRLALLDGSMLGATGAFLVSDFHTSVPATFGAGWQSANTTSNIVQLNEAVESGSYFYLFDRCLELGNDTVLIKISQMKYGNRDRSSVEEAATKVGYTLVEQNEDYLLYHIEVPNTFGIISEFRAIAIGTSAPSIAIQFPAMEESSSTNLNDYTYEQLSKYDIIYLAGFTYRDKKAAEDMLLKLSENGVRIVIAADGIPSSEHTGTKSFLGVTTQSIQFRNGYPKLTTIDGVLDCDLFPSEYTNWNTVFVNGLDECWGYIEESGEQLEFYGTVHNDNIVFIGFNLAYHYALTQDEAVGTLLSHAMTLSSSELPKRTIVPLTITMDTTSITIQSNENNVNTTLAFHDIFTSEQTIYDKNNLTYVNKGTTIIQMHYPYFYTGLIMSLIGFLLVGVFLYWTKKTRKQN